MRSPLLSVSIILTLAFGCRSPGAGTYQLTETLARNYEDEFGMRPGVGFDAISEDVRGECIDFDGIEASGAGQETAYSVKLIESHRDLLAELQISPASQVKAIVEKPGIQVSRKTKFALGTDFGISNYSVYLLVSAKVLNTTEFLKNYRFKPAVLEQLSTGSDDAIKRFRAQCGDSFMIGSTSGGEFYALLEISTTSDQVNATLKDQLRQSQRLANATQASSASDLEGSLKSLLGGRNMRVWIYQRGGAGQQEAGIVTTVDAVMERLRTLAESVKRGENPRPIRATFSDYLTLGMSLPQNYVAQIEKAQEIIGKLADTLTKLMDLRSNIDHVLGQPEAFVGVDGHKLVEMANAKEKIEEKIRKIHEAGDRCGRDLTACNMPDDLAVPNIELPKRKTTIDQLARNRLKITTRLKFLDRDAISDFWSEPECYVEVRVKGPRSRAIPIYKSQTDYSSPRCSNLQTEIDLSTEIIKDTFRQLRVSPDQGIVQVLFWEDDANFDDLIGQTEVTFGSLGNGAQLKGVNNSMINVEVGFELEY